MAESNGISKIVRVITLVILVAGLLITFGVTYGSLNTKMNAISEKTNMTEIRSYSNEKAIISIQRDIKYILEGVDELRGKNK